MGLLDSALIVHTRWIFPVAALILFSYTNADEILGCGGFAKSDIDIDFSQVEVKLYTKQGSLKDHTECAPNNGYYFLPLYDKGEYVLKIHPPAGWSFEPREVNLIVDGVNDQCSKGEDINFYFKGFAIIGKVISAGSNVGPKGVKVILQLEEKSEVLYETVTAEDGSFLFTPVPPGQYIVKAAHPTWQLTKHAVPMHLSKGNADVGAGSLVVAGYDVSGSVTSDGEPIKGVSFILFQADRKASAANPQGCDKSPIPGFEAPGVPLCHVKSDDKGQFVFPVVSPGKYRVVPHYAGPQNIKFDVKPTELSFTVAHTSHRIGMPFQVKGFSVSGQVLLRAGGKGVPGATILLDSKVQTKTREDGTYHLENMQAGSYVLLVEANDMKFSESMVKVTPNTPELAPVFPTAFKVCGSVASHQLPPAQLDTSARNVLLTRVGSNAPPLVVETGRGNREFCHFLEPGRYEASVEVTEPEKRRGLVFIPAAHPFEVVDQPLREGVHFTQLKVELSGVVACLPEASCDDLTVTLQAVPPHSPDSRLPVASTVTHGGQYVFTDVLPGQYEVSVDEEDWCWQESSHLLSVGSSAKWTCPTFKQTGYALNIISSHVTQIEYKPLQTSKEGSSASAAARTQRVAVARGLTRLCGPHPGEYEVTPVGCHGYAQAKVRYAPSASPLQLTATSHLLGGRVVSHQRVNDLIVQVLGEGDSLKARLGPLRAEPLAEGKLEYKFSLLAADGESLTFVPSASELLFNPPQLALLGPSDCTDSAIEFSAEKGHVLQGRVVPALAGVKISVRSKTSEDVIVSAETADDGKFKFDPLPGGVQYQLEAEKDGYVLTGPDSKGVISAHKLAEIVVEVLDKADSKPLQGVLLSLSGGESFRRNSQTGADGQRSFSSLSPGEYYLRPMMKEYRFEPASRMISVQEGATVSVRLLGHQVAFSAYGQVTSLNGEPQNGVVVEAVGQGACQQYQEESSSEPSGQFRVRGLHPQCEYTVRVKKGPAVNENIQRATPDGISIKASSGDVSGLRLVVFHPWTQMDVALLVVASTGEYLRTLKARLCREDSPDSPLHTVKLDSYAGQPPERPSHVAMVMFPAIPLDGRGYFVQLESSLSRATHSYSTHAVHFRANHTFKQVRMMFRPEPRMLDQELGHSSYLTVPILIVAALLWLNQHKVSPLLTRLAQALAVPGAGPSSRPSAIHMAHTAAADHHAAADAVMVEPVLNVRSRKAKPRKT